MKPTYQIKDWDKHFENHESRKLKRTAWVSLPNRHDGKSFRRIADHPEGVAVFAAWTLILEVASKMPTRGILADEDGPLDSEDLSSMTGFPSSIFDAAFNLLTQEKFGWLTTGKSRGRLPKSPAISRHLPESPDVAGEIAVEQNRTEGDRTGKNRTEEVSSAPDLLTSLKMNPAYSHINLDHEVGKMRAWLALPGNKGRKMTPRFVLNWLNKIEQPIPVTTNGTNGHKHRYKPNESAEVCTRCFNTGTETTPTGSRVCDHKELT